MFDSFLRPTQLPRQSFGSGMLVAVAVHAAIGALAIGLSIGAARAKKAEPGVIFVPARHYTPPPPQAPTPVRQRPQAQRPAAAASPAILAPTSLPDTQLPETTASGATPPMDVDELPSTGEPADGPPGDPVVGAPIGDTLKRIRLDDSAVRLQQISGPAIEYTPEAIDRQVEGTMIVSCIVTTTGAVEGCRVLKGLPFMDREVRNTLEKWRYAPYSIDGEPVEVEYTFKIQLKLPQ